MKLYKIAGWTSVAAFLMACEFSGGEEPAPLADPEPAPEATSASWIGSGDGTSWSDPGNWDAPIDSASAIRIAGATVTVDVDAEIAADKMLFIDDATLVIGVHSLLTNGGGIVVQQGTIIALQGGWFQNLGTVVGDGVVSIVCDDGGSVAGAVHEGVDVELGACLEPCIDFNFNLAAGEVVSDQFSPDFTVTAVNGNPSHPNTAIIFDSANPTGDDSDLVTPGYGIANDTALGGLLIIAENDTDTDGDGLIDDPDDAGAGGTITLTFTCAYVVEALTMIDVEEFGGSRVELYNGANQVYVANGAQLDDNSVQSLDFTNAPPADTMVISMTGSGAIDDLRLCPTHEPVP